MTIINDATDMLLQHGLNLRFRRQELLSSNIANIDTPGYQPVDLAFEGAIEAAAARLAGSPPSAALTNEAHMPAEQAGSPASGGLDRVVERPDVTNTLDGNGVDLDREMARITDNSQRFNATLEMARRRYAMTNLVISQLGNG